MSNAVTLNNLNKAYGAVHALRSVSLSVDEGEYVVLLGPSGSGKTTLLSILGGFVIPSSGDVLIHGQDVTAMSPADRPTATVFQDYALFPHMTVSQNVAFGLRMHGKPKNEVSTAVEKMLDLVGLTDFGSRKIDEMSGGQRQRIALARALIIEPVVLLLDEPLGALDLHLRRRMQEELHRLQREIGSIFIHVTHDQEEAMSLADNVVVMNEGRIEDQGPPRRVYLQPATAFTATFMGSSNLVRGEITAVDNATAMVNTPLGLLSCPGSPSTRKVGDSVQISLRPEHLCISDTANGRAVVTTGQVRDLVFHGTHMQFNVMPDGHDAIDLIVAAPADSSLEIGASVTVTADMRKAVLLDI